MRRLFQSENTMKEWQLAGGFKFILYDLKANSKDRSEKNF